MASCSKTGQDNKASHKTVLKWEKEFETKFDCDFSGKDVIRLRCTLCTRCAKRICSIPNFFSIIASDQEQHQLKRIASSCTVCLSHTKELLISS